MFKILILILFSLSLAHSWERDSREKDVTTEIEKLLVNKKIKEIPTFVGNHMLSNPDVELAILKSVGNLDGKAVSTLSAAIEFFKAAENCEIAEGTCDSSITKRKILLLKTKIKKYKTLVYKTWIGKGCYYKKEKFSRRMKNIIDSTMRQSKERYGNLIITNNDSIPLWKLSLKNKKIKKPDVLNDPEYKSLKIIKNALETLKNKVVYEKKIEQELRYSEKYKIRPNLKRLDGYKLLIIAQDESIEQYGVSYKKLTKTTLDVSKWSKKSIQDSLNRLEKFLISGKKRIVKSTDKKHDMEMAIVESTAVEDDDELW